MISGVAVAVARLGLDVAPLRGIVTGARRSFRSGNSPKELCRLNKVVAGMGWCSRREADEYIARGWVTVNGNVADRLGTKVDRAVDRIDLLRNARREEAGKLTVLLHKPLGVVSGQPEEGKVPAIRLLASDNLYVSKRSRDRRRGRGRRGIDDDDNAMPTFGYPLEPRRLGRWSSAGRLDINTTGLLVLTQSGKIVQQIISPRSRVEKEYLVRVGQRLDGGGEDDRFPPDGDVDDTDPGRVPRGRHPSPRPRGGRPFPPLPLPERPVDEILDHLRDGIEDEATGELLSAKSVDVLNENQLQFVLTAGKHHQIRRMCKAVGLDVVALKRVRIGKVVLGDLPVGYWRYLKPDERFD